MWPISKMKVSIPTSNETAAGSGLTLTSDTLNGLHISGFSVKLNVTADLNVGGNKLNCVKIIR